MVLIGVATLGRDAELRKTSNGDSIASVSLAFSFGKKDQQGHRQTQWVNGTIFGDRATSLHPYLTKGSRVYVEVRDPRVRVYEKKDGTSGYEMTGRIAEIAFIGGGRKPGEERAVEERPSIDAAGGIEELQDDIPF